MESVEKDIKRILNYCEQISKYHQKNEVFRQWLEKMIFKFGKSIFFNNLPESFYDIESKKFMIFISSNSQIIETLDKSEDQITYFINNSSDLNNIFTFTKFLESLSQNFPNLTIAFSSFSPFLMKNEIVMNIYNIGNVQSFIEVIEIEQIFNKFELKMLNFNNSGVFQNNLSFIDPVASKFLENHHFQGIIYDFHFNSEISHKLLKSIFYQIIELNKSF